VNRALDQYCQFLAATNEARHLQWECLSLRLYVTLVSYCKKTVQESRYRNMFCATLRNQRRGRRHTNTLETVKSVVAFITDKVQQNNRITWIHQLCSLNANYNSQGRTKLWGCRTLHRAMFQVYLLLRQMAVRHTIIIQTVNIHSYAEIKSTQTQK